MPDQNDLEMGFSPDVWATIEAAQVQAQATLAAAERAVHVAELGLWVQGGAALLTLAAGILAYMGVLRAAKLQSHLEHKKHEARTQSYRHRQAVVAWNVFHKSSIALDQAKSLVAFFESENRSQMIATVRFEEPEEWKSDQWENHAILGEGFVKLVYAASTTLNEFNLFHDRIIEQRSKSTDYDFSDNEIEYIQNYSPDIESLHFEPKTVVYKNLELLQFLTKNAETLWLHVDPT
jgi:hypothetical protein